MSEALETSFWRNIITCVQCADISEALPHTGSVTTISFEGLNNSSVTRKSRLPSMSIAVGKSLSYRL
jgi:hypothetical protein